MRKSKPFVSGLLLALALTFVNAAPALGDDGGQGGGDDKKERPQPGPKPAPIPPSLPPIDYPQGLAYNSIDDFLTYIASFFG